MCDQDHFENDRWRRVVGVRGNATSLLRRLKSGTAFGYLQEINRNFRLIAMDLQPESFFEKRTSP